MLVVQRPQKTIINHIVGHRGLAPRESRPAIAGEKSPSAPL
jgi:hypothetical protein